MFAGRVIGRVVCTRKDESLKGLKLLLIEPLTWKGEPDGDPLVAMDSVGAGAGEFIFFVKAREAAVTVPTKPPVDAAVVGILDGIYLEQKLLEG
ncbi:MAG: EutN/CcmL family microcompartment protein [Candidatus Eremiobacteraeota bacterium]|nr:EutN/CcmL family microcompartment protein [Candidatus Eremiobacteraeota bacterium]